MKLIKSRLSVRSIKLILFPVFLVLIIAGCNYILPNKPPYLEVTFPADSAIYNIGDVVNFQVNAYDEDGDLLHVIFTPANSPAFTDETTPYSYAWQTAGLAQGTYLVEIKAVDEEEEPYILSVPIRLLGNLTSHAGKDTTFTDSRTNFILEAEIPYNSTGTWTIISGTGGLISDIHNPKATFTGISCQTYVLRWTVSNGINQLTDEVTIRFNYQPSKAVAGGDQLVSDGTASTILQAITPSDGAGIWRIAAGGTGAFTDTSLPNSAFTGLPCVTYSLVWTVSTPCAASSDTVEIRFDQLLIIPDAGPDQLYSDGRSTAALTANAPAAGSGVWTIISGSNGRFSSINDPKATFTGQVCQSYVLRWTLSTPCASKFDEVAIAFNHVPSVANAGPDQSYSDGRFVVNLNATAPASGTGMWRIFSGGTGTFSSVSQPNAIFTGQPCNNYKLVWTVSTACAQSADTVKINLDQLLVTANAGTDQSYSDGRSSAVMTATAAVTGTGAWSVVSGQNGTFADPADPKSVFNGRLCQNYTLRWTITTACGPKYDDVLVSFSHTPTQAAAGPDQSKDGPLRTIVLAANDPVQGIGTWSVVSGSGGVFDDNNNPRARFTGEPCQKYVLRWTISTQCSNSTDQLNANFTDLPSESYAGADQRLTDGTIYTSLTAIPPTNGTGLWSIISGGEGTFSDTGNPHAIFAGLICHTYVLRWTVSTSCSSSFDEVTIVLNRVDINADAGDDRRISDGSLSINLRGNVPGTGVDGIWTIENGSGGSFDDASSPGTMFTGISGQIYVLKWSLSSACIENADLVTIAFIPNLEMYDARDEKTYQAVRIGNQIWMSENLNYSASGSHSYQDGSSTASVYGRLYDWSTATIACPSGWHLPTDLEWRQLEVFLGMDASTSLLEWYRGFNEGGMLKDVGTLYWESPNTGATNISGFTARPGGYRTPTGVYGGLGTHAGFWSSTGNASGKAIYRVLHKDKSQIGRDWYDKGHGFSVRCVKN